MSARPTPTSPRPTPSSQHPRPTQTPEPEFDADDVLADIETLADDIGPREATSKNFDEAAELVEKRFEKLGYEVDTESSRCRRAAPGVRRSTAAPRGT